MKLGAGVCFLKSGFRFVSEEEISFKFYCWRFSRLEMDSLFGFKVFVFIYVGGRWCFLVGVVGKGSG